MSEETFDITIRTKADTSGAKEMRAALEQLKAEEAKGAPLGAGEKTAPALRAALDQLKQVEAQAQATESAVKSAIDPAAPYSAAAGAHGGTSYRPEINLAAEQQITAEEAAQLALAQRQAAIESTRMAIVEQEEQLLLARNAGETQRAATLERELLILREQLGLLRSIDVSEEQALRIAQLRVAADERDAAAKRAQAEAAKLAAQAEAEQRAANRSSFGDAGDSRLGKLGRGLGMGGLGVAAGFGAIIGQQLLGEVQKYADEWNQALEAAGGLTAEMKQQVEEWQRLSKAAKTPDDVQNLTRSMEREIEQLREKLRKVGDGPSDYFKGAIVGLNNLAAGLPTVFSRVFSENGKRLDEWKTKGDEIREGLRDQLGTLEIMSAKSKENAEKEALAAQLRKDEAEDSAYLLELDKQRVAEEQKRGQELEANMQRLGAQGAQAAAQDEQRRAKETQQVNAILQQREEMMQSQREEQAILAAKLAGNDELAAKLEIERAVREKIKALQDSGAFSLEVQAEIEKTGELQKQLAVLKEQKSEKQAMAALDALAGLKGSFEGVDERGSKGSRARRQAREDFTRQQQRAAERAADEGAPPAEIARQLAENEDRFNAGMRSARGRIGGPARKAGGDHEPDATKGGQFDRYGNRLEQAGQQTAQAAKQLQGSSKGFEDAASALSQTSTILPAALQQIVASQLALAAQVKVLMSKVGGG